MRKVRKIICLIPAICVGMPIKADAISSAPPDLHYAALTAMFEAGAEGENGEAAVLATINNRVVCGYGRTIRDVVTHHHGKRYAFEVWGNKRSQITSVSSEDWNYQKAFWLAGLVWSGEYQDPTGGATHYWSPSVQKKLGRPVPKWSLKYEFTAQIGRHWFYKGPCRPGGFLHRVSADDNYKPVKDQKDPPLKGVFVQVGAYKDAGNAGKAASAVKQKFSAQIGGHPVFSINSDLSGMSGGAWHHVLIGPFKSQKAANETCRKLSDKEMEKITGRVCFTWGRP